jgi:hypothetical protein
MHTERVYCGSICARTSTYNSYLLYKYRLLRFRTGTRRNLQFISNVGFLGAHDIESPNAQNYCIAIDNLKILGNNLTILLLELSKLVLLNSKTRSYTCNRTRMRCPYSTDWLFFLQLRCTRCVRATFCGQTSNALTCIQVQNAIRMEHVKR